MIDDGMTHFKGSVDSSARGGVSRLMDKRLSQTSRNALLRSETKHGRSTKSLIMFKECCDATNELGNTFTPSMLNSVHVTNSVGINFSSCANLAMKPWNAKKI